jgi:hypothetical protein
MSSFLSTSIAPRVDLYLLRRDYFDGMGLLLQKENGTPYNLEGVQVCATVWKKTGDASYTQVTNVNVEEEEPLRNGKIRLWLTSSQTAEIWDAYGSSQAPGGIFFPTAYTQEESISQFSPLFWDVRIETQDFLTDLISASGGTFITQNNHTLASSERVMFSGTTESSINFDNTSSTIYSGLTNISYLPPYQFNIPALSGVTNPAIGGAVYRLRQDTVIAGNVIAGTTLSNCFP